MPIAGPGATVGPVKTRVSWAGMPQPSNAPQKFLLRTRLSAWRASRGIFPREGSFARLSISAKDQTIGLEASRGTSASRRPLLEDLQALAHLRAALGRFFLERGQRLQNLDEGSGLAGFLQVEASSAPAAERTWPLRPTQSDARDDDDATVAVLLYKAVNKAVASKADSQYCHFGDKGTGGRYAPS